LLTSWFSGSDTPQWQDFSNFGWMSLLSLPVTAGLLWTPEGVEPGLAGCKSITLTLGHCSSFLNCIQTLLNLDVALSLSLRFNVHLPGKPGLAGGVHCKQRTMEAVVTTGAISLAKLQSDHHHQHPVFLQAGCPSCRPTNSVKALKGMHLDGAVGNIFQQQSLRHR